MPPALLCRHSRRAACPPQVDSTTYRQDSSPRSWQHYAPAWQIDLMYLISDELAHDYRLGAAWILLLVFASALITDETSRPNLRSQVNWFRMRPAEPSMIRPWQHAWQPLPARCTSSCAARKRMPWRRMDSGRPPAMRVLRKQTGYNRGMPQRLPSAHFAGVVNLPAAARRILHDTVCFVFGHT